MDAVILARIQFAANMSFHILFPAISIGLGWVLLYFKLRYAGSRDMAWMNAYRFWTRIFALTFAMGVVTGITMSFQFGTNWPGFMLKVGNVAGPLLAYEVLTAFFLEAVFLGIMLFGFRRVPGWVHTLATFLVAFGTTLSAFWIIALDSWMQTPTGHVMRDGVAHAADWWTIVFNPSMPYRLVHMLLASGLTVAFLIAGLSAYRFLRGDTAPGVRRALGTSVRLAALLIPLQIFAGDQHGLNTLQYQPAKIAAMEANWKTGTDVPIVLFAWPDEAAKANRFEIAIPNLGSLILTHDWHGTVPGLDRFEDNHPPVAPLFFAFRIMVGIGVLMLATSWWGVFVLRGGRAPGKWLARALVIMTFSGWAAVLAGWYTTEIGRQPWLVTGLLKTADAASATPASMIATTLAVYLALYALLFFAFVSVLFYLARKGDAAAKTDPKEGAIPAALGKPAGA